MGKHACVDVSAQRGYCVLLDLRCRILFPVARLASYYLYCFHHVDFLWGYTMATIRIKDLPDNLELDHEAMTAIIGGARKRAGPVPQQQTTPKTGIVDFPASRIAREAKNEPR
jgi:hypothetical protein